MIAADSLPKRIWTRVLPTLCLLAALVGCVVLGAFVSFIGSAFAGNEALVILLLPTVWPLVYLATKRFDVAIMATFVTFGFVQFEPAPFDLLIVVMIALGFLAGELRVERLNGFARINTPLWIFLVITLVSLVISDELLHSLRYTLITIYCVGIMYFAKLYVQSAEQMRPIMLGYLAGALIGVGLVALSYAGLTPPEVFVEQTRARGLFKDANVFGPFLVLPILFLADELWQRELLKRWPTWLLIGCLLALVAGLFVSFSRAAWGNLVITSLVYLFLNRRRFSAKQLRNILLLFFVGAAALVLLVFALDLGDFLQYRANAVQSYDSERFTAQFQGIQLGLTNLFGIGPGMMDRGGLFAPHSLYIRTFAEHGFFAFAALFYLLYRLVAPVLRMDQQTDTKICGLSPSMVAAVAVGLYLNSFLIDTIHWRHFWFALGLLWLMQPTNFSENQAV